MRFCLRLTLLSSLLWAATGCCCYDPCCYSYNSCGTYGYGNGYAVSSYNNYGMGYNTVSTAPTATTVQTAGNQTYIAGAQSKYNPTSGSMTNYSGGAMPQGGTTTAYNYNPSNPMLPPLNNNNSGMMTTGMSSTSSTNAMATSSTMMSGGVPYGEPCNCDCECGSEMITGGVIDGGVIDGGIIDGGVIDGGVIMQDANGNPIPMEGMVYDASTFPMTVNTVPDGQKITTEKSATEQQTQAEQTAVPPQPGELVPVPEIGIPTSSDGRPLVPPAP